MAAILFVRTSISYYLYWRHLWVGGDWNISGCFARIFPVTGKVIKTQEEKVVIEYMLPPLTLFLFRG